MPRRSLPKPPVPLWRSVRADPRAFFSEEEIARSKAYQEPLNRARVLARIIKLGMLVTILWTQAAKTFVDALGIDAWPLQLAAIIVAYNLLSDLVLMPITVWIQFRHERGWGFSTITPRIFITDMIKGYLLLPVLIAVAILLWAIIRATDLWWFYGAAALTGVLVILQFLGPWLLRIFNKFTPLDDPDLLQRIEGLAAKVGARISAVFVVDASKRSKKDNAAFTGLGRAKQVLIFDNMLEMPHDDIEVVVAHEFGHWRRRTPVRDFVLGMFVEGPVTLGAIAAILSWDPLLEWAGVDSVGDPASLPLVLLAGGIVVTTISWYGSWRSRWNERVADFDSLDLTGKVEAYRDLWRRMPERNLPDLDPPWWRKLKLSHPPVAERLAFADVWERLPKRSSGL